MGIGGQDTYIMTKAYLALWFWPSMNFAPSTVSKKQSNGNASWVYYMYSSLALVHANVDVGNLYIYTYVGLSALLVSTYRVMRRPIDCGTSDMTGSTFLVYVCKQQHFY